MLTLFLVCGVVYFVTQTGFNCLLIWEWDRKRRGEKQLIRAIMENNVVLYKKPPKPTMDA